LMLVAVGFLLRVIPLLQYPRVGGDPFLHYAYSMALLNGKLSLPVEAGNTGTTIELYYPPLFHLITLAFFLAFPHVDPYVIMKILASAMDALILVPVYLIVKHVSGSSTGGLLASYALMTTRNDYQMLSWGGYANIAGLLLGTSLVYAIIINRLDLSAIFTAALGLTHHLSTIFLVAFLTPYFAILLLMKRRFTNSMVGVIIGGIVSYVTFYAFAWRSILYYYSNFSPAYDQALYMTAYILELVGPLLLISAAVSLLFLYARGRLQFVRTNMILLIWLAVPFILSYAYLLGVQWHGVRWIAFIPEPLAIMTGVCLGGLEKKRLISVTFILLCTLQLLFTIQGYQLDILHSVIR
jgi:hypothetical protein